VSVVEQVLRRERAVVAAGLAALTVLAWLYLWRGAGMAMGGLDMTSVALFPHLQAEPMPGMEAMPFAWAPAVAMWGVMRIAVMTPGAAPLILLYGRVLRHAKGHAQPDRAYAPAVFLVAGYLAVWLGFSVVAAALQSALEPAGLISPMMLWSKSAALSATVLAAAGLYQLSPLKNACLRQCRGPVEFLTRRWRPGASGAFVMGVEHGAWCVGCCWMLMALLFVGGLMNFAWIAVLTFLVLIEKLAPAGPIVGRISGVVLLAWAVATILR
jgi:predicted metal-binding membrane protein